MDFKKFSKNLIEKTKIVSSELITNSFDYVKKTAQVLQDRSYELKKHLTNISSKQENNNTVIVTKKNEKIENIIKILDDKKSVFITGGAGTGKSYILRKLKKHYKGYLHLTSSTGISAININGQTIHSWAGIGICNKKISTLVSEIKNKNRAQYKKLITARMLAIDEISMLTSDCLDYLNLFLKNIRENDSPFGGIQMIFIGDFFQLPPVIINRKIENKDFCFNSNSWKETNPENIILTEVKRQTDIEFINILNDIRKGCVSTKGIKLIWDREYECLDVVNSEKGLNILRLFATNNEANKHNRNCVEKISGKDYTFKSEDKIEWSSINDPSATILLSEEVDEQSNVWKNFNDDCRAVKQLQLRCDIDLKTGCRVMLLQNINLEEHLANGSCGTVINVDSNLNYVDVLFDNGRVERISKTKFEITLGTEEKVIKKINPDGNSYDIIANQKKLVRYQIPLALAYGITIHKSQGMTFNDLIVDCKKIFADGQAYVALSRTKSLAGLYPLNFDEYQVKANPFVIEFYKKIENESNISVNKNVSNIVKGQSNVKNKLSEDEIGSIIMTAILYKKKVNITYLSDQLYDNKGITIRKVRPLQLKLGKVFNNEDINTQYILDPDSFYLKAFCELRQDNRTFLLKRIQNIELCDELFS